MGNNCMETQVQRTYTVEEIARILGISTRKAYDFCSKTSCFKVLHIGKYNGPLVKTTLEEIIVNTF